MKNAEACKLMDKLYRYHHEASGDVLLLDGAFNIESVAFKGQMRQPYKDLDDFHKVDHFYLLLSSNALHFGEGNDIMHTNEKISTCSPL